MQDKGCPHPHKAQGGEVSDHLRASEGSFVEWKQFWLPKPCTKCLPTVNNWLRKILQNSKGLQEVIIIIAIFNNKEFFCVVKYLIQKNSINVSAYLYLIS